MLIEYAWIPVVGMVAAVTILGIVFAYMLFKLSNSHYTVPELSPFELIVSISETRATIGHHNKCSSYMYRLEKAEVSWDDPSRYIATMMEQSLLHAFEDHTKDNLQKVI